MNRRICINCQTVWRSVADHELEAPHNCPSCGDQLVPSTALQLQGDGALKPGSRQA